MPCLKEKRLCDMPSGGDCCAQHAVSSWSLNVAPVTLQKVNSAPQNFDAVRAARMGGYGFCFYGPYQHFWYGQLDKFFPTKSLAHFGSKVCYCAPLGLQDLLLSGQQHCNRSKGSFCTK